MLCNLEAAKHKAPLWPSEPRPVIRLTHSLNPGLPEDERYPRAVQLVRRQAGEQGGSCHAGGIQRLTLLLGHCSRSSRWQADAPALSLTFDATAQARGISH